jgi:hypothetical protein
MEYEGSIGLVSKKIKKNIADFHLKAGGTSHTNSDSEWGNESFVQQILPYRTNVMPFLVTILGSRNQNKYTQF